MHYFRTSLCIHWVGNLLPAIATLLEQGEACRETGGEKQQSLKSDLFLQLPLRYDPWCKGT